MATNAGTARQVISLPQGGGALSGIGETFKPDLHTGTGNFSVPINVPGGRNGLQPDLSLSYSTGQGNGPFGLGWQVSVPGVQRKTAQGVPRYQGTDTFILSGTEDLVLVAEPASGITRYQPRTEGLFARIERHLDDDNDYWRVASKDGLVSIYGTPGRRGNDPAAIADPDNRQHIFSWRLSETQDTFGNRIVYEYERDTGTTEQHHWDQLYLRHIAYGNYTDGNRNDQFLVRIAFHYEDRADPFSSQRAGFEIRTRRRCTHITIHTHADQERLYKTYHLTYLDQRDDLDDLAQRLPRNGVSLLNQIRVIGHDEQAMEELPPLMFGYTHFQPEQRDFFPVAGAALPAQSLASPDLTLADLNGDGLPDILEMGDTVRSWRNRGNGMFDRPRPMQQAPAGLRLADPGVQLLDADGNGRIDLMTMRNGLSGYFPLQYDGTWDQQSFQRYRQAPGFHPQDPEVQLVDLDGDGVTDAIRSGSRLECFFHDPAEGWNETRQVPRQSLDQFPDVTFSDRRVRWADMSGDGLQDIVLVYAGNVDYWPNQGYGSWGRRVHMENSPRFPYGYDPARILIGDVDGDGLADILYVEDNQVTLWLNQSGNSWSAPIRIEGTPSLTDMHTVQLVDLLGSGVSGLLWSADAGSNGPGRAHTFFLDFTGGIKPYLLNEMDNNLGAVTRVEYASSTQFFLADQENPPTRWQTHLPFPVLVVARTEVIDAISAGKLTTEYRYHHGYWDGAEREFHGFGMVEQYDTESFADYNAPGLHGTEFPFHKVDKPEQFSPPTLRKTWFHQGAVGPEHGNWRAGVDYSAEYWPGDKQRLEPAPELSSYLQDGDIPRRAKRDAVRALRGRVVRTELYALDGTDREERPFIVTEQEHSVREESPPDTVDGKRRPVFFPSTIAERTTHWDRGDDPLTTVTFIADFDAYGQPRQQTEVALPRRSTKREKVTVAAGGELAGDAINETRVLATHTFTQYARPSASSSRYIHDRVAQQHTFELHSPPEVTEHHPAHVDQVLHDQIATARQVAETLQIEMERWRTNPAATSAIRLFSHTLHHYDGPAFDGLPVGAIGAHGALTRTETLVFTPAQLDAIYGNQRPAYLGGNTGLPVGAPGSLGQNPGYRREQATNDPYADGYYADTTRRQYDVQDSSAAHTRGLVTATQDALGHQTEIAFDQYWLLPMRVIDSAGLETHADYNYRILQPDTMTDPNGHTTHIRYTPLGQVSKRFLQSRTRGGGSAAQPEVSYTYDFRAYERTRDQDKPQPIFTHETRRIHHASSSRSDETIESRSYSDGFGRLIQERAQAPELIFGSSSNGEDVGLPRDPNNTLQPATGQRQADRVIVSGWKTYDNKGQVIEAYEPFFAGGWGYQPESEAKQGAHITQYYDPRGRVIHTINPDGSEQRVIFGIPKALSAPEPFAPTPWERYAYDANDNASRTHAGDPELSTVTHHHDTPTSEIRDALGRTIGTVTRNRTSSSALEQYVTQSRYDIRDNVIAIIDALGRSAFTYAYDLRDTQLRTESIDAGLRTVVQDAAGNLLEQRDSKGSIALHQYDTLNRPTHLWAQDNSNASQVTLRERLMYGDDQQVDTTLAEQNNLRGRLYKHYDEAGLLQFDSYDFKGNVSQKTRYVISDAALSNGWIADWSATAAEDDLEADSYTTEATFDALNRPTEMIYPADVNGQRAVLTPTYDRAGNLAQVDLDGDPYVEQLAYNARGQRKLIANGNGLITRYAYDPQTFRLVRLRTEQYQHTANVDTWEGTGAPLQDMLYHYDLVGNILSIDERTPNSGIANTSAGRDQLTRTFGYDPLYRLVQADGRACDSSGTPRPPTDANRCGFRDTPYSGGSPTSNQANAPDITERYTETYRYDPAGNLLELKYQAQSGTWKRTLNIETGSNRSNRLRQMTQGSTTYSFTYDANGNLIQENTERRFTWDHADRLTAYENRPAGGNQPSVEARYLYGADGIRVKKWVRTNGSGDGESVVYVDDIFEQRHWKKNGRQGSNNHLHVMDDQQRIAIVRRGTAHPDDAGPAVQYHLGDHLGSSSLVVNANGQFINREEYFPYGETSFGSFARKRYRFTGKERDAESGLYYHGARYYAPWLARWVSTDPAGAVDGNNLYLYTLNNPLMLKDTDGRQSKSNTQSSQDKKTGQSRIDVNKVQEKALQTIRDLPFGQDVIEKREIKQKIKSKETEKRIGQLLKKVSDIDAYGFKLELGGEATLVGGGEVSIGIEFVWFAEGKAVRNAPHVYLVGGAGVKGGAQAEGNIQGNVSFFAAKYTGNDKEMRAGNWEGLFSNIMVEGSGSATLGAEIASTYFTSGTYPLRPSTWHPLSITEGFKGFAVGTGPNVGVGAGTSTGLIGTWHEKVPLQRAVRYMQQTLEESKQNLEQQRRSIERKWPDSFMEAIEIFRRVSQRGM